MVVELGGFAEVFGIDSSETWRRLFAAIVDGCLKHWEYLARSADK